MREPLLVINPGSSSIKFSIFSSADHGLVAGAHGEIEDLDHTPHLAVRDHEGRTLADHQLSGPGHEVAIAAVSDWFAEHAGGQGQFVAVGHRVVHGGPSFAGPVLVDDDVLAALESLVPLAPLHQPQSLAIIRAFMARSGEIPQVACFDTAFHREQPLFARQFALPRELTERGLQRYGFHGLSYEFIVSALPKQAPAHAAGKLVVAHLGNGASMCAIKAGRSVATTMSLTPLDGLMMGTRCGTLDPGLILFLLQHEAMTAAAVEDLLYHRSGLLGVSGLSNDMRTLLASEAESAKEAVGLFVYRITRELGSLVAAMGGIDALIFTGGIGEHAPSIRARVCGEASWLGLQLDEAANMGGDTCISTPSSKVAVLVIPTDENLVIARHTRSLLDRLHPQRR